MKPPKRSAGRDRPGLAMIAGVAGLAATVGMMAWGGDAGLRLNPPAEAEPARIGMNSCAARGCHGAVDSTDPAWGRVYIKDGAYTTWLNYDPHARAFAVLLEKRSIEIAGRLRGPLEDKPAHQAGLCLSCHSTAGSPGPKEPELAPTARGIDCEACHGPAENWRDKHLSPAWRALPSSKKVLDGLADLGTPTARARSCVPCHVGDRSRGMDVNHDLIAAGHPRLNFEFASYQASYPKHWKEKGDPAGFEAKSWAIGQVVDAQAVLDLLSARARDSGPGAGRRATASEAAWPEFSEYECFACHHDLANPSPRQVPGRKAGRLAWQAWPSAMLPELIKGRPGLKLDAWKRLGEVMTGPEPDPQDVVKLADEARGQLGELLDSLESRPPDSDWVGARLSDLATRPAADFIGWDRAAQRFLALRAMARASKAAGWAIRPDVDAAVREASKNLEFPRGFDSPREASAMPKPEVPARPVR